MQFKTLKIYCRHLVLHAYYNSKSNACSNPAQGAVDERDHIKQGQLTSLSQRKIPFKVLTMPLGIFLMYGSSANKTEQVHLTDTYTVSVSTFSENHELVSSTRRR
ncbi:hypothetical protein ISCGN_033128 [Ixodes scapularis]